MKNIKTTASYWVGVIHHRNRSGQWYCTNTSLVCSRAFPKAYTAQVPLTRGLGPTDPVEITLDFLPNPFCNR